MVQPTVLIIEDEINLLRSLAFTLREEGIEPLEASNGTDGIELASQKNPDVVLLDLKLPDMNGFQVLEKLERLARPPVTLMISAHGDTRAAVEAVKKGAQDYITKPFDLDELLFLIRRHTAHLSVEQELSSQLSNMETTRGIVGRSKAIVNLREQVSKVGKSAARSVLLTGPSGSGKSLVASALHQTRDAAKPFVTVNCASLPDNRLEEDLFGVVGTEEKDAVQGLVALADGGVLLLDEIGEMPAGVQAKMLTFLETLQYRPVGAQEEQSADILVIAATNKDLEAAVTKGEFRRDLYFRLNVLSIVVPPLAEHSEDIPLLAQYFAKEVVKQDGGTPIRFMPDALERLVNFDWQGNVRELQNLVESLSILHAGKVVETKDLPKNINHPYPTPSGVPGMDPTTRPLADEVNERERQIIQEALDMAGGRKILAAEWLGISRHALKRRMQKYGLGDYS